MRDTDMAKKAIQDKVENLQRAAYLDGKDIDPTGEIQLDMLFEIIKDREDFRHIPNDFARSSLFTARSKRTARVTLTHEKLFHFNESISILYTGIELRAEDDELVWLQILNYGRSVPMGEPFTFNVKDLVKDLGWPKNGRYYDKARECISRLKANEILAQNNKAYGSSGATSLIQKYKVTNGADGKPLQYQAWLDRNLIVLFAGHTFTTHRWQIYRDLKPVARRLADYIESHKHPYPLALDTFKKMCGSLATSKQTWKQTVKLACREIEASGIAKSVSIQVDKICASK